MYQPFDLPKSIFKHFARRFLVLRDFIMLHGPDVSSATVDLESAEAKAVLEGKADTFTHNWQADGTPFTLATANIALFRRRRARQYNTEPGPAWRAAPSATCRRDFPNYAEEQLKEQATANKLVLIHSSPRRPGRP